VSRRDAELLLDRSPTDGAHAGLVDLLAAASAPPRRPELAGERAAVAAFRRECGARPAAPARPLAVRSRPRRHRVAVAALSVVAALVGGTAYAAGTNRLPDPVQRRLHEALSGVGVPAPSPSPSPPASPGASPDPAYLTQLCRAWQVTRTTPGEPRIRPDEQRTLAAAAGGPTRIADYCAALTAPPSAGPSASTTPDVHGNSDPGRPPATPPVVPPVVPPGNGGNGNGTGNGNPAVPPNPADPGNGNGRNGKGNGAAG
jgi:hypothetical protein